MSKFNKVLRNLASDLLSDLILAASFGAVGILLIIIGSFLWVPLVIFGAMFLVVALFLAKVL